jgi:hypothetical protein
MSRPKTLDEVYAACRERKWRLLARNQEIRLAETESWSNEDLPACPAIVLKIQDDDLQDQISVAADNFTGLPQYDPAIRQGLLDACGLKMKETNP